jgi:putative tricarboxylic transport membrane protein
MVRIRAPRDAGAALVFLGVGLAGLVFGADLPGLRSAGQLGPGTLPRALSWILIGFAAVMAIRALSTDGPPIARVPVRALLAITAAVVAFGTLIELVGYLPAAVVAPLVAAGAAAPVRPGEAIVVALALGIGSALLFVVGLGQPLRLWIAP